MIRHFGGFIFAEFLKSSQVRKKYQVELPNIHFLRHCSSLNERKGKHDWHGSNAGQPQNSRPFAGFTRRVVPAYRSKVNSPPASRKYKRPALSIAVTRAASTITRVPFCYPGISPCDRHLTVRWLALPETRTTGGRSIGHGPLRFTFVLMANDTRVLPCSLVGRTVFFLMTEKDAFCNSWFGCLPYTVCFFKAKVISRTLTRVEYF